MEMPDAANKMPHESLPERFMDFPLSNIRRRNVFVCRTYYSRPCVNLQAGGFPRQASPDSAHAEFPWRGARVGGRRAAPLDFCAAAYTILSLEVESVSAIIELAAARVIHAPDRTT